MKKPKEIEIRDWVEYVKCTGCLEFKPISLYSFRKDRNQYQRRCNKCLNEKSIEWKNENRHKIKITQKNYRIKSKEKIRERRKNTSKNYYEKNKEIIKIKRKEYVNTERHRILRKKLYRKWYDIWDKVSYKWMIFKIVDIKLKVWYAISRQWLPPIIVARRYLKPITYTYE